MSRKIFRNSVIAALLTLGATVSINAALVSTYYGDDDGFGIGQTSGLLSDPHASHQGVGEAAYTDQSLISSSYEYLGYPAFTPTGSFSSFILPFGEPIAEATLTLKVGSFDKGSPIDGPYRIYLDGLLVDSAFIDSFPNTWGFEINTRSFNLDSSFFALLADGVVSLSGTNLSESSGAGAFQVDFMRLDITTGVPEPSTAMFGSIGLLGFALSRRIHKNRSRSEITE